ncbi:MAG: T9SS type A sorting domain-containing protein, partial [Ginsengibacter sp.]
ALLNSSKIFYRLKVVSAEGSPKYSNTIVVSLNKIAVLINGVTPNPFRDKLNINLNMPGDGRLMVRLKDITGRLLLSRAVQAAKGFSTYTINGMDKFNAGMYFLSIEFEGKLFTYKIGK